MSKRYFTIGMAGHIDHGKTSLTKALTNVDTDRLKEEKERQISIELGFAPLFEDETMQISVIDVPGHEKFIRQMIAGVAGIDLVVLVVAADEGVMPQTKEHLQILRLLGIQSGIVVISKIDKVDEEFAAIVQEEITDELQGTVFENAPVLLVDSISKRNINQLKELIKDTLQTVETKDHLGPFRLPIDQVFTVKGQGTVVRGTVYEGMVEEGQDLLILPQRMPTKARQVQVHHHQTLKAFAGQRAAINLSNIDKEDLKRGDVLVSSEHFVVTRSLDVNLTVTADLDYIIKQRMPIKCHIGTAEVMGRIVFFDRNEMEEAQEDILCQLRLEEEIVTKRGDRFILRRPTPVETIGGGWVIDPRGEKYRFGNKTMEELAKKKEGTKEERLQSIFAKEKCLSIDELIKISSMNKLEIEEVLKNDEQFILVNDRHYTYERVVLVLQEEIFDRLNDFHRQYPMRLGLNKAQLLQVMSTNYPKLLIEFVIDYGISKDLFQRKDQYISLASFKAHIPSSWVKKVDGMMTQLKKDDTQVKFITDYLNNNSIPATISEDLKHYLVEQQQIISLDEQYYWHIDTFNKAVKMLKSNTEEEFDIGQAKDILGLSRKYMIPLLECLDNQGLTKRMENKRIWK